MTRFPGPESHARTLPSPVPGPGVAPTPTYRPCLGPAPLRASGPYPASSDALPACPNRADGRRASSSLGTEPRPADHPALPGPRAAACSRRPPGLTLGVGAAQTRPRAGLGVNSWSGSPPSPPSPHTALARVGSVVSRQPPPRQPQLPAPSSQGCATFTRALLPEPSGVLQGTVTLSGSFHPCTGLVGHPHGRRCRQPTLARRTLVEGPAD